MNEELTDIVIVLDCSGSMQEGKDATIEGVNAYVRDQAQQPGKTRITEYHFSSSVERVHHNRNAKSLPPLTRETYTTLGSTALLDAIALAIEEKGQELAAMPEHERPTRITLLIVTDGEENASRRYSGEEGRAQVFRMIAHQRDKYSWQILFMGAEQDAITAGAALGLHAGQTLSYGKSMAGTQSAWEAASKVTRAYRTAENVAFAAMDCSFTDEERKKAAH